MNAPSAVELDRDLTRFCEQGLAAPHEEAAFNALALRVFAYQYEAIAPYHAYCQRRGALPQRLRHWTEIPAVPAQAFKDVRLYAEESETPAAVFRTSGTTAGDRPGEHYMSAAGLALYDASLLPMFRAHVLPELEGESGTVRSALVPLVLGPPPVEAPHSSLWHMVDVATGALFKTPPRYFQPAAGLDFDGLVAALNSAKHPVCLLTTDLALDAFLAQAEGCGMRIALAKGSRVMHTGGPKGRQRTIQVDDLYARVHETLAVPPASCVNEYGMTELASQFYDDTLRRPAGHGGEATPRLKHGPPWVRTIVADPQTLEPLPPGEPGLLRFYDLANRGSALCLQTEDRGVAATDEELDGVAAPAGMRPFRLLGRAPGSEARGCSLDAGEIVRA